MAIRVAVDFGTSSTCVVAAIRGRDPQVAVIDGQPLMSSAFYLAPDGTTFVGQEADRQAAVDPARYEPNPKRRIDEGELLLGSSVVPVVDVIHSVLRRAVTEARRLVNGADVELLVLTHPAEWGVMRTRLLRQAGVRLARSVVLVPEPVAAAFFYASTFMQVTHRSSSPTSAPANDERDTLAVLDLGGGTVDVSVMARASGRERGFRVLATRGNPHWGGADIDQLLLEYVGSSVSSTDLSTWSGLLEARDLSERRRRRALLQDIRGAKETLSRHSYTDVPLPSPFADTHVTRADLERLIAEPLRQAVKLTVATIEEAGLRPEQLAGIFLVGGSSRIPLVSRLVHETTGLMPTVLDQPETVVARGALLAATPPPDHQSPGHTENPSGSYPPRTVSISPGSGANTSVAHSSPASGTAFSRLNAVPQGEGDRAGVARRRTKRARFVILGAALLAVAAVAIFFVVKNSILPAKDAPPGRVVAQYDYKFFEPMDWEQAGGSGVPADRKVVVKPSDARGGDDLVVVQEYLNGFDASADPSRLANELRQSAEQLGPQYSGFTENASYAGKTVIYYRETKGNIVVDWYVTAKGGVRVHVGCQYAGSVPQARVQAACEQIVRTVEITISS